MEGPSDSHRSRSHTLSIFGLGLTRGGEFSMTAAGENWVTVDTGEHTLTHDDWQVVYKDLTERLGRWDSYFDVSDPYDHVSHEPVRISLADDLADIYRDVKNGLLAEQSLAGARPNDLLWTWRFEFESHWAAHAAGALRALQTALLVHYAEYMPESFRNRPAAGEPDAGQQQDERDGASRRTLS